MKNLFVMVALFLGFKVFAQAVNIPIPVDPRKNPVVTGLGQSYFSEAVTLTTTSYAKLYDLPSSGVNADRPWKGIAVRNPSATRTVYICFGTSSACSGDAMKLAPSVGFALDHVMFGTQNGITAIWGKLDSAGSVAPEVTVW